MWVFSSFSFQSMLMAFLLTVTVENANGFVSPASLVGRTDSAVTGNFFTKQHTRHLSPFKMGSLGTPHFAPTLGALSVARATMSTTAPEAGLTNVNDLLVERLLLLEKSDGWKQIRDVEGITVCTKKIEKANTWPDGIGPLDNSGRFAAVMAHAVIEAPPDAVADLLRDDSRVNEYNSWCAEVSDVKHLDPSTKICWSATAKLGLLTARDFVTRVHERELEGGGFIMAHLAEQLECEEERASGKQRKYVRMEMLLGGHIIRPSEESPGCADYVQITHANPGGAIDTAMGALIVNAAAANSPVEVVRALRSLAPGKP